MAKKKDAPPADEFIDIGFPVNYSKLVPTGLLIQGDPGAGKSQTERKIIEVVASIKGQQIIFDPEGEYSSLREKFDFALISRENGDIPLSVQYAETIALMLLETGMSAIIDISEIPLKDRVQFVKRFFTAFMEAPRRLWHQVTIYLDEAQIFAPEGKGKKGLAESRDAIIDLATRGRKRAFGRVILTQRLALLDKSVAAMCRNKLIGQTTLAIDRKRAAEELGFTSNLQSLELRDLAEGEFYAFGPAFPKGVNKVKIDKVITTHPNANTGNQKRTDEIPPTPTAIKKILAGIESIPEAAGRELETKKQFEAEIIRQKKEILELTRSLKAARSAPGTPTGKAADPGILAEKNAKIAELQGFIKMQEKEVKKKMAEIEKWASGILADITKVTLQASKIPTTAPTFKLDLPELPIPAPSAPLDIRQTAERVPRPQPARKTPRAPVSQENGEQISLGPGEQKILTYCAQYPNGCDRDQLTGLTGYKRSSRDTYIHRLRIKGLITQERNQFVPTQEGLEQLGPDFEPLPTGQDLQEYWLQRLGGGEQKILQICIEAYPRSVTRNHISELTEYTRSSRDTFIHRLSIKEILEIVGKGEIKASKNLFD